jgi:osmotically inducible protein OsmC
MGAIELAAAQKKITLPAAPVIDATIELYAAAGGFFLKAHLHVGLEGLEREIAQGLVDAAHQICPYSKATRGNIDVSITLA